MEELPQTKRSSWGRSRFGGGTAALLVGSAALGLVAAIAIGAAGAYFGPNDQTWFRFVGFTAFTWPGLSGCAWALLVDPKTQRGAVRHPEQTVEASWRSRAGAVALRDLIAACGALSVAFAVTGAGPRVSMVLNVLCLFGLADWGLRYWILKRRES